MDGDPEEQATFSFFCRVQNWEDPAADVIDELGVDTRDLFEHAIVTVTSVNKDTKAHHVFLYTQLSLGTRGLF